MIYMYTYVLGLTGTKKMLRLYIRQAVHRTALIDYKTSVFNRQVLW